ncbi:MAG TPA: response regulator [Terriglobales bacterium]|nr:response regulator [Terriglobales bacterium]
MDVNNDNTKQPKILLVDDNDSVRTTLSAVLAANNFRVNVAANVSEALHLIDEEAFDVLLCDLHMPGAGDGFTVVSAMRHTNPDAVTLVFTGYPALQEAMDAILLQADEILVKPMDVAAIAALIRTKLQKRGVRKSTNIERVASILERDNEATIARWLARVNLEPELTAIPLDDDRRTGHLPKLLQELVRRLRVPRSLGTKAISEAAALHGKIRQSQGYSVSMLVEESRVLQVSIFETLQKNLNTVDFSLLLMDVMTIADEVDSQLKQTINSFMEKAAEVHAADRAA